MNKLLSKIIIIFLSILGFVSCTKDTFQDYISTDKNSLEIKVSIPTYFNGKLASRANSIPTDYKLNDMTLLVFNKDNNENFTFSYSTEAYDFYTVSQGKEYLYTIKAKLKNNAGEQIVAFAANVSEVINKHKTDLPNKTLEEVKKMLIFKNSNWNTLGKLPMWYEIKHNSNDTSFLDNINLQRSVASVDVLVNGDYNTTLGLDNFKIAKIRLYNTPSSGYVAPQTDITLSEFSSSSDYIEYICTSPSSDIRGKLFMPETNSTTNENSPFLLIGGYFGKNNTSKITWYKLAFAKGGKAFDIKRNTKYVFNISDVNKEGYQTPEEAIPGDAINMRASILLQESDGVNLKYVVYNENSYLATSSDRFYIDTTNGCEMEIKTDAEGGWSISNYPVWLNIDKKDGATDEKAKIKLTISQPSNGKLRKGKFTITAGDLKQEIEVYEMQNGGIIYMSAKAIEILTPETLECSKSEYQLSGGIAFSSDGKYLYTANNYHKIENDKFVKRPYLIVYDIEQKKVVKKIEEWDFKGEKRNFEASVKYPDKIHDIAIDEVNNRLFVMRKESCVDVFNITDRENPTYITRMGEMLITRHEKNRHEHSGCMGTKDGYVYLRSKQTLNLYKDSYITAEKSGDIVAWTSTNRVFPNMGYIPLQFALDKTTDTFWITEMGNETSFKGVYQLGTKNMPNREWQAYDPRDTKNGGKSVALDFHPTGMVFYGNYVYFTTSTGGVERLSRESLGLTDNELFLSENDKDIPLRTIFNVENYKIGKMRKIYVREQKNKQSTEECFWTLDDVNGDIICIQLQPKKITIN